MPRVKISISRRSRDALVVVSQLVVESESRRRLTRNTVARLLAPHCPGFTRAKGRYAAGAGVEVLPVLEKTEAGWRAWRLDTGDDSPSGWQPPLPGRAGRLNSRDNPFADRSAGVWLSAEVSEC